MAFEDSFNWLMPIEGRYCNWKNDRGGETWKGIARNPNPQWDGWSIIDEAKSAYGAITYSRAAWNSFSDYVEQNYPQLEALVAEFYQANYWNPLRCDEVHPAIGHLLFDFGVNSGLSRAAKHLQRALVMNGLQITVDGKLGAQSIGATQQLDPATICQSMLNDRVIFYQTLAQKDPSQASNLQGWLNRCQADSDFIQQLF